MARCGCRPKARQMRATAMCDSFVAWAMERVLQCVAWGGVDSRVRVTTASTWASVISRGAPAVSLVMIEPWQPLARLAAQFRAAPLQVPGAGRFT